MKEIFDWVPWFQELASSIREGGQQYLAEKAREVDWGPTDPPLLKFGDENIDPFSFFYYLAARNSQDNWKTVYRSVAEVFEKRISIDSPPEEGFYFPTGRANNTLFHGKYSKPPPKITWNEYRQEMEKIKNAFPGCECYEIQMFAYLWKNGLIPVNFGSHYQVSTNVFATNKDYWNDFAKNCWVYTGGMGSGEGWPSPGSSDTGSYGLRSPKRGDIALVRYGRKQGRGIGVVYQNDYKVELSNDSKLHVLWLNKTSTPLTGQTAMIGFSKAGKSTFKAFNDTLAYSATFKLLQRLHRKTTPPRPVSKTVVVKPPVPELVTYSLNQIFYGPPGTGKTWNAEKYAVAVVDGVDVKRFDKEHRARLQKLRFKRKTSKEGTDTKEWTGQIAMVTFHQSFSYEDFVEGIRPKLEGGGEIDYELRDGIFKRIANTAWEDRGRRYVLVIDEINRGNIPKILGELITLVEDSRRLGKPGETKVTLPYSNEDFGVPKNLHIIGTMNTADRSILLLDTALRRRFDFVEMMPDPEHQLISDDIQGVKIRKMLKAINERILLLLDREHQIGHTYLFHVKDMKALADKFQNAIFPLLQEYFYDDWSKIREVLGRNGFVVKQELDYAKKLQNSDLVDGDRIVYERLQDGDPKWRDPDEYKKIYSDNSNSESS